MAGNELQTDYLTGKTVYFVIRNSTGLLWHKINLNFVTIGSALYINFAIASNGEQDVSGFYTGTMPSAIPAGVYSITAKEQAGGSPAESDISVGDGDIQWDGSAVLPLSSVPITAIMTSIIATLLEQDVTGAIENAAAIHSLATVILKLTSSFNAKTGVTTKTDGITAKMTQPITTDATLIPVKQIGVGV